MLTYPRRRAAPKTVRTMPKKLAPIYAPRKSAHRNDDTPTLQSQLNDQRRVVDFETFDIQIQQLLSMMEKKVIDIAPAYQRQFRWDDIRCSQLVESIFLGIPIPSLFMATNDDSSWELVDGVQRLSTLTKFAGSDKLRERLGVNPPLSLKGMDKLSAFCGLKFADLPDGLRLHFQMRPMKVITLSGKSDPQLRFDLFERLNTGGVTLTDQEIRDCVYRGRFADLLEELAKDENFRKVVRLTAKQNSDGTREECVLRFFAFYDRYQEFDHSVRDFLNGYMQDAAHDFDEDRGSKLFRRTFQKLALAIPSGIHRPGGGKMITPLNLFEGVAVGAALAITRSRFRAADVKKWLGDETLRAHTTQATNDKKAVRGRIEFCRDRFLGK